MFEGTFDRVSLSLYSSDLGTVVPRLVGRSASRTPRMSGHASSGTQPRESNGKKSKKRIKNEVPNVLQRNRMAQRGLRTR